VSPGFVKVEISVKQITMLLEEFSYENQAAEEPTNLKIVIKTREPNRTIIMFI